MTRGMTLKRTPPRKQTIHNSGDATGHQAAGMIISRNVGNPRLHVTGVADSTRPPSRSTRNALQVPRRAAKAHIGHGYHAVACTFP